MREAKSANFFDPPVFVLVMDVDEDLYRRIKRGDVRAFDVLYGRHERRLFGFLLTQVRDHAEAEDLFHEAFLATLDSREVKLDGDGAFCGWLYRIARNLALNRIRARGRSDRAMSRLDLDQPEAVPACDEALGERELLSALDQAIARLPPSLSELYHLRSSGLRYEEMATALEMPLGTIKSRMHQLVAQLREELKPWTAT